MAESLSELAKRLRPYLISASESSIGSAEGPGVDIAGNKIGLGGDSILVYHADGAPCTEYAASDSGLTAALADTESGDIVWLLCGAEITGTTWTIPAGVHVMGMGRKKTILTGEVALETGSSLRDASVVSSGGVGMIAQAACDGTWLSATSWTTPGSNNMNVHMGATWQVTVPALLNSSCWRATIKKLSGGWEYQYVSHTCATGQSPSYCPDMMVNKGGTNEYGYRAQHITLLNAGDIGIVYTISTMHTTAAGVHYFKIGSDSSEWGTTNPSSYELLDLEYLDGATWISIFSVGASCTSVSGSGLIENCSLQATSNVTPLAASGAGLTLVNCDVSAISNGVAVAACAGSPSVYGVSGSPLGAVIYLPGDRSAINHTHPASSSLLTLQSSGSTIGQVDTLNFAGTGVTSSVSGSTGTITITAGSGGGGISVTDTATVDLTLTSGSVLSADVLPGGISHTAITDIGANTHGQLDTILSGRLSGSATGSNTGDQVVPANEPGSAGYFLSAYNSATGAWTKAIPSSGSSSSGSAMTYPNLLVNGCMRVNQGPIGTTTNTYTLDQWRLLQAAETSFVVTQDSTNIPTDAKYSLSLTVGAANNNKGGIFQAIEGANVYQCRGKTVSLSFDMQVSNARIGDVRAAILEWAGTEDAITNTPVSAENWGAEGTNPTLNTWTYANTPVNLNPTTSWQTIKIENVSIAAGTNNLGVLIWVDDKTTTTDDRLSIAKVKLEPGATATPFVLVPYDQEFRRCQWYYQVLSTVAENEYTGFFGVGQSWSTTRSHILITFPQMRIAPAGLYSAVTDFYLYDYQGNGQMMSNALNTPALSFATKSSIVLFDARIATSSFSVGGCTMLFGVYATSKIWLNARL